MDTRNFTFICDVDGQMHRYAGVAVTDIDNHVHIPLRPIMEHLKLDWMTMYDRAKSRFSPTTHKLPSKRGVRDTFCLIDMDMQGILDSIELTRIKDVAKAHIVGRYVSGFVASVMTQCVTKSEPSQNPDPDIIRIDQELSREDKYIADIMDTGKFTIEQARDSAATGRPLFMLRDLPAMPKHIAPGTLVFDSYMRRMNNPSYTEVIFNKDKPYERRSFLKHRGLTSLPELEVLKPDHPALKPGIDPIQAIHAVDANGREILKRNPNFGKPVKPYWRK